MFRVKKEDYNTIQFIPEYGSGNASKKNTKPAKVKGSNKRPLIIIGILIFLIIAVAALAFVYFTYFSPAQKYLNAMNNGDFDTCTTIYNDNAFDPSFIAEIESVIISSSNNLLDSYLNGTIKGTSAVSKIEKYNSITDNAFVEQLQPIIDEINSIDSIKTKLSDAENACIENDFKTAMSLLMEIYDIMQAYSLDYNSDISSVLETYKYNFKYEYFMQAIDEIDTKEGYPSLYAFTFMTMYFDDEDLVEMTDDFTALQNGEIKASTVRRFAKNSAAQAKRDIQANSSQTEEQPLDEA